MTSLQKLCRIVPFGSVQFVLAILASAQPLANPPCDPEWIDGLGWPGAAGSILAIESWDPDGAGGEDPLIVLAGSFASFGGTTAAGIVAYQHSTDAIHSLGDELGGGIIRAITTLPSGELVVGGEFRGPGSSFLNGVAVRRDGVWEPLAPGAMPSLADVRCLLVLPNGDLLVGGWFSSMGGIAANSIARWDGVNWHAVGPGPGGGVRMNTTRAFVNAMVLLADGSVAIGGRFNRADTLPVSNIAIWDGIEWENPGGGVSGTVNALHLAEQDQLFVGGAFTSAGGIDAQGLAVWDGLSWREVGGGLITNQGVVSVNAMAETTNGSLAIAGSFAGSKDTSSPGLILWDGSEWHALGPPGLRSVGVVHSDGSGHIYLHGSIGAAPSSSVLMIDDVGSSPARTLAPGLNGFVTALATNSDGDIVAAGRFSIAGRTSANGIALRRGATWEPLGTGIEGYPESVAFLPNGAIAVSGYLDTVGSIAENSVGIWHEGAWTGTGSHFPGGAHTVLSSAGHGLVAASYEMVSIWNGAQWTDLAPEQTTWLSSIAMSQDEQLYAVGCFDMDVDPCFFGVVLWDGTTWTPVGQALDEYSAVEQLMLLEDGTPVLFGELRQNNRYWAAMRLVGGEWLPLGDLSPMSLVSSVELGGGRLLVGSYGAAIEQAKTHPAGSLLLPDDSTKLGESSSNLAEGPEYFSYVTLVLWNGFRWEPVIPSPRGPIFALARSPSGLVHVGGSFLAVADMPSTYLASADFEPCCEADITGDGLIDVRDLVALLEPSATSRHQADQDVIRRSLGQVLSALGTACP